MRWLLVILATAVLASTGEARGRHRAAAQQPQAAYVEPVQAYYAPAVSYYAPAVSYYVAPVTYAFSPVFEVPAVLALPEVTYAPPPCEPPEVPAPPPVTQVPMQPAPSVPAVPALPGTAVPEPAPPSPPEMLPPTSPSTSRRVSAFRTADPAARTNYSVYNSRNPGRAASPDRASVTIWNLTGRTLVLSLNGRTVSIEQGRRLEVETPRTFTWQVAGQSQEVTSVPETAAGLTLAIRN